MSTHTPYPSPRLFQPILVGNMFLGHRAVVAPATRSRADKHHIPTPVMKEYYSQRGSTPGTLIITEATAIAERAGGFANVPGIYSEDQVKAWKDIVKGVHEKGSFIISQLWACGRQAVEADLKADDPSLSVVGPSPIRIDYEGASVPRELTIPEIEEYVQLWADAAHRAIHEVGFDGVEVHGGNGYLIDQFLQDVSNQREDEYGGSVEGRSKLGLDVVRAVVNRLGTATRVGVRLSPWSPFGGMGMDDPVPQYTHFVSVLKKEFPDLAYIHVIEPRVAGDSDYNVRAKKRHAGNDFLREIWAPKIYISAGGYNRENAIDQTNSKGNELVAFGRAFIANPDLPIRLEQDIPLTLGDRSTYYSNGDTSGRGYTDYPFANRKKSS